MVDFLEAIGATLDFECAIEAASNGEIPCVLELDSMIHDALGGGPSQGDMTVVYRGGRTQALSVEVLFAADPAVHRSFMEFAVARPSGRWRDGQTPVDRGHRRSLGRRSGGVRLGLDAASFRLK